MTNLRKQGGLAREEHPAHRADDGSYHRADSGALFLLLLDISSLNLLELALIHHQKGYKKLHKKLLAKLDVFRFQESLFSL